MSLTKVTYSMISGSTVNVCDFGADPTGATNSSSAIQAAIDSLNAGDTLIIPAGTYIGYDININKSQILVENHGNFTLPANTRESFFKIAEGMTDVVFRNYGILDGNRFNQGNPNTIPLGTGILEVSNDTATAFTYRIFVENYGEFKNGANNGIYVHRKVNDFTLDPAGYFEGHRNDGFSSSSTNTRFKIANGIFSACGAYGQAIASAADYTIIDKITVKNPAVKDDGVTLGGNDGLTLGHSGTPQETSFNSQITNCQIIDIGNSQVGILIKAGLSDKSIIANNQIVRTVDTTSGVGIRLIGGVANTYGMVISNNVITGPWGYGIMNWDYTSTGYSINECQITNNYIRIDSNNSEAMFITSGTQHSILNNWLSNSGSTTTGIRLDSSDCSIINNDITVSAVGIKVNSCEGLICTNNRITASSTANSIVFDQYDADRMIALNNKTNLIQSGAPIMPLVVGSASTNQYVASGEVGNVKAFTVALNNQVSGKTGVAFSGAMYFVSNLTDGTHAIFVWTSATASGGFAILSSQGANWSTTYNDASKEGIAFNASTEGPFIFSNRGSSKNYQIVCFGGS